MTKEPQDDFPEVNKDDYKYITDDDSEGILRDERALAPLILMLESGPPEMKAITIEAIGAIPTEAAMEILKKHLSDPDEAVREAAKTALARYNT
jgi:HEAT repeat protein